MYIYIYIYIYIYNHLKENFKESIHYPSDEIDFDVSSQNIKTTRDKI